MSYQYVKGAISCSNATEYTGSFIKIQALGDAGDQECLLDRVEFGQLANPEISSSVNAVTGPIEIPAGSFIDGPIMRFKTGTNGVGKGFLAYYTK